jgi:hypothetical protein
LKLLLQTISLLFFLFSCQGPLPLQLSDNELAEKAFHLKALQLEDIQQYELEQFIPIFTQYKNDYRAGLIFIKKLVHILDGEERIAYERKVQQLETDLDYWEQNVFLLPKLTPQDWKRQKHKLQELYSDIAVTYRKLYKELVPKDLNP